MAFQVDFAKANQDLQSNAAVLGLFRLKDHFVYFVSVRGSPFKIIVLLAHCG